MSQKIELMMDSQQVQRLAEKARELTNDYGLGLSQSCHVLLDMIDDGSFAYKPKKKKTGPEKGDEKLDL